MRLRMLLTCTGLFWLQVSADSLMPLQAARAASGGITRTVTISMTPGPAIDPLIYGVNYVWDTTSQAQFPSWIAQLQGAKESPSAPATLVRYPGGWDGEWYEWIDNALSGGPGYSQPGVAPAQLLAAIQPLTLAQPLSAAWDAAMSANGVTRGASFQLPIRTVLDATSDADLRRQVKLLVAKYLAIVRLCGNSVKYWEIGNEWWGQDGSKKSSAPLSQNAPLALALARYAEIVAAAAPVLKAEFPNIRLYATADWSTAGGSPVDDEFVQLRKSVGQAAWAEVDGISIHPYCGSNVQATLCSSIPSHVAKIETETGKTDIYASEWAVVRDQSTDDWGIRNANATVAAIQDLAVGGISEASYWPSIGSVAAIALANGNGLNATGVVFRMMSLVYEGRALSTQIGNNGAGQGQTVAVAALNDLSADRGVGLVVASNGDGPETIQIPLVGTGLSTVSASSVIYSDDPNDDAPSRISHTVDLPVAMANAGGSPTATFTLNPGTAGRGSSWEVAVLELQ